jgi:diguanylate cyclase
VLQTLAGHVLRLLRRSDFVARCGGEEFAALLPATPLPQACAVAEKIRAAAEASPVPVVGGVTVTLSIGATEAAPGDTAETLFSRAEKALARAKAGGRNRVEASRGA